MSIVAPTAPGRIGVPLPPEVALAYLTDLRIWVDERRRELDTLDGAVLRSPLRAQLTRDMMLAMALWKAVSDRLGLLEATWDSGRVGPTELERMATLIWGRLDATLDPSLIARADARGGDHAPGSTAAGLAVSLPEACRLSDAMASQLRTRLAIDPNADAVTARLRDLRAQLERLRDQVALEPAGLRAEPTRRLSELSGRVDDMVARVGRGGDIGGMIGPAEIDAARFERDLIVGGVERRKARDLLEKTRELRDDLVAREAALQGLVNQTLTTVSPAPKYAVPDVDALGPLPSTRTEIEAYARRLQQVSRAMGVVQDAYAKAMADHTDLTARMARSRSTVGSFGADDHPDLVAIGQITDDVLARRPSPIPLARELVEAFETCVQTLAEEDRRR
ncbi:hypothetical protein GCM10027418_00550 [Mariniluteicoccus endophyticus]